MKAFETPYDLLEHVLNKYDNPMHMDDLYQV